MSTIQTTEKHIEVGASDLPLHCPTPGTPQWNSHPRVSIPVEKLGTARCPYCSTLYKFQGELPKGHH